MAFIYCMFCNSVSDIHSAQLQYCRTTPTIRSGYRPIASDVFECYQYPTIGLGHNGEDFCTCGFEYSRTQYSTLDDRPHRWTSPVSGWHQTRHRDGVWPQVTDVTDLYQSSYKTCNCCSATISDYCCQTSVKRRAQFYSELPASHRSQCCSVMPGLCKSVCVHGVRLACIGV